MVSDVATAAEVASARRPGSMRDRVPSRLTNSWTKAIAAWPQATTTSPQNSHSCVSRASSLMSAFGATRCGTSNRPKKYIGRSALTESNHQPDSGTANSSR